MDEVNEVTGAMEHSSAANVKIIEDYKLEELLRCPYRFIKRESGRRQLAEVNWRQLVQYTVSHVINDFYSMPLEGRTSETVTKLTERWWTTQTHKFENAAYYWEVKEQVSRHLIAFLTGGEGTTDALDSTGQPIIQFEQHRTFVKELHTELTQIFQIVVEDANGSYGDYKVLKFVVDEDDDVIQTFQHMTAVFCENAFGRLPTRIDVLSVLTGKRHTFHPSKETMHQSVDFMRLVQSFLPEADRLRKNRNAAECRSCPLRRECFAAAGPDTALKAKNNRDGLAYGVM